MAGDLPARRAGAARRLFKLRPHLQQRGRDEPQSVSHPHHGISQPDAKNGAAQRRSQTMTFSRIQSVQTNPESQPDFRALSSHIGRNRNTHKRPDPPAIPARRAAPARCNPEPRGVVRFTVHGNTNKQVARDGQCAANHANRHRVDDGAQQVRLRPDGAKGTQRKLIPQRNAHPQLEMNARSTTPSRGTPMVTVSQKATTAPATQRHLPSGNARA